MREMKPTDEELYNKGLTRNESRSARGVYIGREAGQFLFDLWRNGQIKGKRAAESVEIICKMSEYIKDAQKKNDVQAMAAKLLAEGESWDCINVAIQTMAARDMEAKSGKMKQGWLFFGAGFEEELKQRGRFAARSIEFLRQKIKAGEGAQRASENAEEVARQGYTVTRKEGSEEYTLEELVRLMERFKHMASDAELMRDSLEWDGESKLDPIARYLTPERKEDMEEQMRREQEEKEREAREYLEAHVDSLFGADGMGSAQMVERNEEEKRYRVVNDTTGLSEHLNDVVKPIEINFTPKDAPAENTTWVEDFKEFYSKFLAGKELVIKRSGHKMYFHDSSEAKSVAVKGVRSQKRNETGKKMEEVVVEAYHLYQGTPEHKEKEGKHRKKMVNASDEFHVFGHPATVNGEKMMVCFTAIHRKDEKDPKRLRFYEFGTPSIKQKEDGEPFVRNIRFHRPATPSEDTLADYLKNVNSDFEGKPEIVEEESAGESSMSVVQAKERGLFKNGVMELGNGVLVDGGADFSASVDFSHVSPALYRKPDKEHVGTGEGNAVYGWGVLYGAENPMTNRFYHGQFTYEGAVFTRRRDGKEQDVAREDVVEGLKKKGAGKSVLNSLPHWSKYQTREALEEVRAKALKNAEFCKNLNDAEFVYAYEQRALVAEYLLENDIFVTEGIKYPVNYRMRADVDDSNLLHWDEKLDRFLEEHPDVAGAFGELLNVDFDTYFDVSARNVPTREGRLLYEQLAKKLGSARAASEWLDEHGIRGVKYEDGMSRNKEENKTYNYVIFNPDYIEVIAINNRHEWSEYSEDNPDWERVEDVDFSASVRNLAAVHTLSVDKFLAAGKMGGMPLPSVAVTRLDRPYRWGNEDKDVTLVGRPEMVDPERGTQVYERDAWTGSIPQGAVEERNGRMVVNLGWGNYEEATPERLAELMEGRKRRGFEATSNWVDPKVAARAYLARRLRSMDEVKGMRERLSDEEERVVDDEEIEEWMESVSELGLGEQEWQSIFEALADIDEVTEESVREAIMRWEPEGDDFVELWYLKESDAMKEGSEFLQGAVRVISGLREEVRDYLEAVPQRAVGMNEWAYALYSENLEGKEEVRRVCLENGIVPVEYKEDARDEALWDLAYDGEVSFSMVERDLYRELHGAFKQVKEKDGKKVWVKSVKKGTIFRICPYPDIFARLREWKGNVVMRADVVKKLLNKHNFSLHDVARLPYALWDPVVIFEEKAQAGDEKKGIQGRFVVVTDIQVENQKGERKSAMGVLTLRVDKEGAEITDVVTAFSREEAGKYKNLLEGRQLLYADTERARDWAREEGRTISQLLTTSLAEPDSGVMLKEDLPDVNFNFPGGDRKNVPGVDFSSAMRRAREMELTRRVHELLLGRREEREAKAMVEAWDAWMERFKAVMAGKEGERSRLGRGMEAMARMVALLESTRAALPGRYRVGWLDVQLRWATWYAQMMESGEVSLSEELKDDKRYAAWAARFRDEVERKAELGVDEQGLKEFLADMVGKRMDAVLENVAAKCRRTLERFLKDRARERMDDMARRLYPKRERGKAWPRGKADAETYRFVQEAYKQMDAKPGERGESGDYEAETQRLESLLEEETDEGKRAELSKEVMMRRMFGEWGKMSYEQALAAEEYFTERVMSGRDAWAEKQQARREKIAYMKAKVRETKGWKGYGEEAMINAQVEETAAKGTGLKNVINFPFYAFTSFTGKMMGWRKELGGWFAERMSRKWAQMNVGIKGRTDELQAWFMQAVGTVSGRKTAEGIADWIRETLEALKLAGVDEGRAGQIARMEDGVERMATASREGAMALSMAGDEKVAEVSKVLAEKYPGFGELVTFTRYYAEGKMPKLTEAGVDEEGRKVYEVEMAGKGSVRMSEGQARAFVESKLEDMVEEEQARLADAFLADRMVDALARDKERWVTEDVADKGGMNRAYFARLAAAARVQLAAGRGRDEVVPEVHEHLTLGELERGERDWEARLKIARHDMERERGEAYTEEEWAAVKERLSSPANRTRLRSEQKNGRRRRTLLRYARGLMSAMDVLEEVTEDNLVRYMEGMDVGLEWFVEQLRGLGGAMGDEYKFLRKLEEGESGYELLDVVEGIGKVVRGKVLADTAHRANGLPGWVQAFLDMLRRWVEEAGALMKLGAAVNEALKADADGARRLDEGFRGMVEELVAQDVEWLRGLQAEAGREAQGRVMAAGRSGVARVRGERPILQAAEAKQGEAVRREQEGQEGYERAADEEASAAMELAAGEQPGRVDAREMDLERGRELAGRFHAVEGGEAVVCDVPEVYDEDERKVKGYLKELTKLLKEGEIEFSDGTRATVSRRTRMEMQRHLADRRVLAAYAKVRELAGASVYLYSAENSQKDVKISKQGIVNYHYYLAKGDFSAQGKGEAYVCIAVSEYADGQRVYDITLDDVAAVEQNKEEAEALPAGRIHVAGVANEAAADKVEGSPRSATRIYTTGQAGTPSRGRIHDTKRYVNYIDRVSQEKGEGEVFGNSEQLFGNSEQVGGESSMSVRGGEEKALHEKKGELYYEQGYGDFESAQIRRDAGAEDGSVEGGSGGEAQAGDSGGDSDGGAAEGAGRGVFAGGRGFGDSLLAEDLDREEEGVRELAQGSRARRVLRLTVR